LPPAVQLAIQRRLDVVPLRTATYLQVGLVSGLTTPIAVVRSLRATAAWLAPTIRSVVWERSAETQLDGSASMVPRARCRAQPTSIARRLKNVKVVANVGRGRARSALRTSPARTEPVPFRSAQRTPTVREAIVSRAVVPDRSVRADCYASKQT